MEDTTTFSLMLHLMQEGKEEETILYVQCITTNAYLFISRYGAVLFIIFPFFGVPFTAIRSVPSSAGRETHASFNIVRRVVARVGRGVAKKCDHRSLSLSSPRRHALSRLRRRERGVINLPLRGQFSAVPIFVVIEENRAGSEGESGTRRLVGIGAAPGLRCPLKRSDRDGEVRVGCRVAALPKRS